MKEHKEHQSTYWISGDPKTCDVCHKKLGDTFIDGCTIMGPWGILCNHCFNAMGIGLGVGRGQKYEKQKDGRWLKVA